jgi:hypothetical protein
MSKINIKEVLLANLHAYEAIIYQILHRQKQSLSSKSTKYLRPKLQVDEIKP